MADKKLTITFELDTKTFEPKLVSSTASAKAFTDQMNKTATGAKSLQNALNKMGAESGESGKELGKVKDQSHNVDSAIKSMNAVVRDVPNGFGNITNSIEPLIRSFSSIQTETGTFGSKLKVLGQSFMGPNGILTLISLATVAINLFTTASKDSADENEEFATSLDSIKSSLENLIKIKDPFKNLRIEILPEKLDPLIKKYEELKIKQDQTIFVRQLELSFDKLTDIGKKELENLDLEKQKYEAAQNYFETQKFNLELRNELFELLKSEGDVIDANTEKTKQQRTELERLTDAARDFLKVSSPLEGLGFNIREIEIAGKIQKIKDEIKSLGDTDIQRKQTLEVIVALLETQQKEYASQLKIVKELEAFEFRRLDAIAKIERIKPLERPPEEKEKATEAKVDTSDLELRMKTVQSILQEVGDEFTNFAFTGKFAVDSLIEDIGRLIVKMLILKAITFALNALFPGAGTIAGAAAGAAGAAGGGDGGGGGTSSPAGPAGLNKAPSAAQIVGAGVGNAGNTPILKPVFVFENIIDGQKIVRKAVSDMQGRRR